MVSWAGSGTGLRALMCADFLNHIPIRATQRKFATTLTVIIALLAAALNAHATDVVGTISGSVGVSPSGTATYSVPIVVPVGTTGVQPKIALSYDSRAGNGLLGMGWSVTGLSQITRCATDNYLDNLANGGVGVDGVDYDDNDKLCLNGQRLVSTGGAYGADGTEYRTVFASFSKVVSYGTAANGGPTHFKVWRKSGEIFEYGLTDNAREKRQSDQDIRAWHLSKISDVRGNYVEFSYHNDQAAGEFWISRIDYTGNAAQGLAPYNHIDFVYATRPDPIKGNYAGDEVVRNQRLTNIKVYTGSELFQDYQLTYGAGATGRSRITHLTQCANDGTCFKPTEFAWSGDGGDRIFHQSAVELSENIPNNWKVAASGDFNGDGRTDLYLYNARSDGRANGSEDQMWLSN
ncbi:MAG: SpvB/TcaC N-terminal domain-containing protein, partial [Pseudomonadota bacterium]